MGRTVVLASLSLLVLVACGRTVQMGSGAGDGGTTRRAGDLDGALPEQDPDDDNDDVDERDIEQPTRGRGPCGLGAGLRRCSGMCPFNKPDEGGSCDPDTPRCRYGEEFCECLHDGTWFCPQDCELTPSEDRWVGDGCDDCPLVDGPEPGVSYDGCRLGAPACYDRHNGMFFCNNDRRYEYYLLPD